MRHNRDVPRGASNPRFDVVILGGGPAGSAAALALKQTEPDLRVLLIEADARPNWRVGETLAPAGRQLLAALGCGQAVAVPAALESFQSVAAWGSDRPHSNEFVFSARGNAALLDRERFNGAILAATEGVGAILWRPARFEAARPADGRWQIQVRHAGGSGCVFADCVVEATGRVARFARTQGSRQHFADQLVGVAGAVRFAPIKAPRSPTVLTEARESGWWYSAPLPDGTMAVVWMSDADLVHRAGLARPERWLQHLAAAPLTGRRLAGGQLHGPLRVWPARSHRLKQVCGDGWIAVGDAASSWDPLSSAGLLKALRTGKLGAFAGLDFLRGARDGMARYQRCIDSDYVHYRQALRLVYGLERRWPLAPFWARRQTAESGAPID